MKTYSVFAFSDLEDLELLLAGAEGHLSVDLIVNSLGISERTAILPIRPEGSHELPPVNHAVAVVELVGDRVHFQTRGRELVLQDAVHEVLSRQESVAVLVQLAEEVRDAGLLVVVVLEEPLAPFLPVEVLDLLELLEVAELVLQPAVAFPGHHPDVTPLVPECLGSRAPHVLAYAGTAENELLKK